MRGRRIAAVLATALLLGAAGCTQQHEDKRGRGDAPVAQRKGDDSPAFCTNMPDGFGNLCGKCVAHFAPWAVVVTTNTSYSPSNVALFQAPEQCGGKVVSGAPPVVTSSSSSKPEDDD